MWPFKKEKYPYTEWCVWHFWDGLEWHVGYYAPRHETNVPQQIKDRITFHDRFKI